VIKRRRSRRVEDKSDVNLPNTQRTKRSAKAAQDKAAEAAQDKARDELRAKRTKEAAQDDAKEEAEARKCVSAITMQRLRTSNNRSAL
jgi:hypothetical protein